MRLRGMARIAGLLLGLLVVALGCARAAEDGVAPEESLSEDAAAILETVSGIVEIQRDGEWFAGEDGVELALEDEVRTDVDSYARIRFLDDDPDSAAEATLVDLSPDTTVAIEELAIEQDEEGTQRTGLLGVLRGAIHAITKGWGSGSLFSVRAGTTVCGIRGSVANVGYDPEGEEATVTSLDGEMYTFEARDRREAMLRTREAMRDLRRGRRNQFLSSLDVGHQVMRNRSGRVQRRRLEMKKMMQVRRAALDSRRVGLRMVRGQINSIPRVKAPKRRPGRMAKRRIEKRIHRRQDRRERRRPVGVRKKVQDRLQNSPVRDRLRRGTPDKLRKQPRNQQPAPRTPVRDLRKKMQDRRAPRKNQRRQRQLNRKKRQIKRQIWRKR